MQEKTHWMLRASKGEVTLFTELGIPGKGLTPSVLGDLSSLNSISIRTALLFLFYFSFCIWQSAIFF